MKPPCKRHSRLLPGLLRALGRRGNRALGSDDLRTSNDEEYNRSQSDTCPLIGPLIGIATSAFARCIADLKALITPSVIQPSVW